MLCVFVAACGFEAKLPAGGDPASAPDAAKPPDAAPDAAPDAFVKVCAAGYVAVPAAQTTSKYRKVNVQTEWLVAKADCESDGGHLVIPETTTEAIAIHELVAPLSSSPYYWAGISDPDQDGQWMTVTNVPFPNIPWGSGDPDQRSGEIYAIVYSDGKYFDWFDYGTQEYACECE